MATEMWARPTTTQAMSTRSPVSAAAVAAADAHANQAKVNRDGRVPH